MSDTQKSEESQIAEFQSEEYDGGELVKEVAAAPEPKEKVEAAPAKDDTPEPGEEDVEQPPATGEDAAQPPKKTAQERINEITRARREAERRAEAAEARARELEARLNAPPAPAQKEEPAKKEEPADDPNAPKPDAYEYGELDSRYIRDLARFEADKRFNELRAEDQQKQDQRAQTEKQAVARTQFEKMIERGSKVHEDFYEKVVIGSEEGKWPMSETLGEMMLASDVSNDIAYHLATNPEEADRVYRSSPVEQARYFGRLEAKFSAEQAAASVDDGKPAPRTPKAPAPVQTARGAGGQFQATADTDDFAAFEARANSRS